LLPRQDDAIDGEVVNSAWRIRADVAITDLNGKLPEIRLLQQVVNQIVAVYGANRGASVGIGDTHKHLVPLVSLLNRRAGSTAGFISIVDFGLIVIPPRLSASSHRTFHRSNTALAAIGVMGPIALVPLLPYPM
jgi:hypothetical protein